jgi:hypothetical protein
MNLDIGDIIEFTMEMQGILHFLPRTKAEIVGKGKNNIFYARLLYSGNLLEINTNNIWFKKVEDSKIEK